MDVLNHIVEATQYCLLTLVQDELGAKKVMDSMKGCDDFLSKIELGTMFGCKCIAWSSFHNPAATSAISFAQMAILNSPNCPLWHSLLGKNLRRCRREESFDSEPSRDEINCLLKSYELSRSQCYGISVAQMYKETKDVKKSMRMYLNIYEAKPTSVTINLKLALAFSQSRDFERAEKCLDYLESRIPNHSMYLHYKAIYFLKQKNFKVHTSSFEYKLSQRRYYTQYVIDVHLRIVDSGFALQRSWKMPQLWSRYAVCNLHEKITKKL